MPTDKQRVWAIDQLQKSLFFQRKFHEWGLLDVAQSIENLSGESLDWNLHNLNLSEFAWNRIIHSGIKPIIVFAHPTVLTTVPKSVSYYRMLAMASQKSMKQIGIDTDRYEKSENVPTADTAKRVARRVNHIISRLIENEHSIHRREFDLWRGMAAGTQAQGSWQNEKGDQMEFLMRSDLVTQLSKMSLIVRDQPLNVGAGILELTLSDGRIVRMGSEPDIMIYSDYRIHAAVEVKGGIDTAGVLERVGAAIKSLSRAKDESPGAITILVMSRVSLSEQAIRDIDSNKSNVNYLFTVEDIMDDSESKKRYYNLLGLAT